eukprot:TRINITY_DN91468_c0_g1_i1.p1 TRINITY_DN91468_c0_g1~~TRINITY_DN91468_c0_g1_i1.p1  ORF type:complete len:339 (+),score=67.40 TRINITY_DN91468_c0_g1_i1:89-1105(+)
MAASSQSVRFSVVSFAAPGRRLAVVGSCSELGSWNVDTAQIMKCYLGSDRLQSEPDFHSVDVRIPADAIKGGKVEYKFIDLPPAGTDVNGNVRWEQLGGQQNRLLVAEDGADSDGVLLLPVEKFAEGNGSEADHTGRFYQGVKERGEISVRRVTSQLLVGSCPRHISHLDHLKSLGVTTVVNFQTEEDCKKNCVPGIGMEEEPLAVAGEYEKRGMEYIWLPTYDMSTIGRVQMLPHGSFLFASLQQRGHVVYSHCNAGVGRSVAAVCGYLVFSLGLSERQMQHIVARARPVAYFDFDALRRARPHYAAMFGSKSIQNPTEEENKRREEAVALLAPLKA